MDIKLIPFSCCLFYKGFRQSILIDTQRLELKIIPNTLVDFIDECNKYSYNDILKKFNKQKILFKNMLTFYWKMNIAFLQVKVPVFQK
jgi:hypothetical protein